MVMVFTGNHIDTKLKPYETKYIQITFLLESWDIDSSHTRTSPNLQGEVS